jgi:hypothetical protein
MDSCRLLTVARGEAAGLQSRHPCSSLISGRNSICSEERTTACPAPLINLHFSQLGVVTACCFNRAHVLGVYPKSTVREIWEGAAAAELREALARGDLSRGCEKCAQQIQARDFGGSHAVFYTSGS